MQYPALSRLYARNESSARLSKSSDVYLEDDEFRQFLFNRSSIFDFLYVDVASFASPQHIEYQRGGMKLLEVPHLIASRTSP